MKNKSIAYKLFFINIMIFSIFIIILIGFQSAFFSKFYIDEKVKAIEKNIIEFSEKYLVSSWSLDERRKEINYFIEKNNAVTIMTDQKGNPKDLSMYEFSNLIMIVKDSQDLYYTVLIDDMMNSDNNTDLEIKKGQRISFEGIQIDDEELTLYPTKINSEGKTYINENAISNQQSEKINGTVVYIEEETYVNEDIKYKKGLLVDYIYSFFDENNKNNRLKDQGITTYYFDEPNASKQDMLIVNPIVRKNGNREYMFVLISLQPVDEAIIVMEKYYGYVFLLAMLLALISSYIYSKIISKPLININKIAENMANLDFSTYCEVKSDDEMGNLSRSLNTLSKKLDSNMNELKEVNEKLKEDIEREKKEEQIRREFVASVSHELKTPLGVMKGFAEGIKDGIYEEKKDYYLEVIIDEINKMNDLVIDMLELSKLEGRVYKLNKSNFDIKELIINVKDKLNHMIEEKDLMVDLNVEHSQVYGDKRKIEQVIVNLFSNAIRYSENNNSIRIKTEEKDQQIYVCIENSGSHIPEELLDKIWERFYRVDKSRSRTLGGTGLGLAIVKNILEMHKNKFGVRNTEIGIEFYFSLSKV